MNTQNKRTVKGHTSDRYTLELEGFLNFVRIHDLTLEQARQRWQLAKNETYKAYCDGEMKDTKWQTWHLYQTGMLVLEGDF